MYDVPQQAVQGCAATASETAASGEDQKPPGTAPRDRRGRRNHAGFEDAASIDGCTPVGLYWRALLLMSKPALATVAVLTIVGSWNAFLLPLIILFEPDTWTLPIGVTKISTQYASDRARIPAFLTVSMIPALAFYLVAERQLIGGLTAGSVKG